MNLIHLGQLHEHPGWGPTMTASIVGFTVAFRRKHNNIQHNIAIGRKVKNTFSYTFDRFFVIHAVRFVWISTPSAHK